MQKLACSLRIHFPGRTVWLIPLFVLAGAGICNTVQRTADGAQRTADQLKRSNLLLTQQLDWLSTECLQVSNRADQEGLRLWVAGDERFVALNRSNDDARFDVATAMVRLAWVATTSGDLVRARTLLDQAREHFERCSLEEPSVLSFRLERVKATIQLASITRLQGDIPQAIELCQVAMRSLELDRLKASEESDDAIKEHVRQLAWILFFLERPELAQEMARTNIEILNRLIERRGDVRDHELKQEMLNVIKKCESPA